MHARLHHDIERWVEADLISNAQAEAIVDFEDAARHGGPGLLAEGLGYVGSALAVGAGYAITQNVWTDISTAGRLSLIAILAFAMFAAGWALRRREAPALQRLTDVLWLGTVAAAGAFAGLFSSEVAGLDDDRIGVAVGVTAVVIGGVLWMIRHRSLELVALAAGVLITATAVTSLVAPDSSPFLLGSAIWILGAAFLAAGHFQLLPPHATAKVLGAAGLAFGSQVLAVDSSVPGSAIAVATAAALVVYAVNLRDNVMLAFGGIMVLVFTPQFVFAVFGESLGAPVALFATGVALVVIAISISKARSTGRDGHP